MIDHIKDKNQQMLHEILSTMDVPDFVRKAPLTTEKEAKDLTDGEFVGNRTFPIHSKADCWLSYAYFNKQADSIPLFRKQTFKEAFEQALKLWEIDEELQKKACEMEKTASGKQYKIDYRHNDNIYHTTYVHDRDGFRTVEKDLLKKAGKYTYSIRKGVAEQLLKTPFAEKTASRTELEKTAGNGIGMPEHVKDVVRKRAFIYKKANHSGYKHLEDILIPFIEKEDPAKPLTKNAMDRVIKSLDLMDRACKLHEKYGSTLQAPEQEVYQFTENDRNLLKNNTVKLGPKLIDKESVDKNKSKITYMLKTAWDLDYSEDTLAELSGKQAVDIINYIS